MTTGHDHYFSIDIETDGPVPGRFSMLSLGAVLAGTHDGIAYQPADLTQTFYAELSPVGVHIDEEALAVTGLDRDELLRVGRSPASALAELGSYIRVTAGSGKPIIVAYPVSFDCAFLLWYYSEFGVPRPFGISDCLDLRTACAIRTGIPFGQMRYRELPEALRPLRPHTHHALEDAIAQAELFSKVMQWPPEEE